jgi:hypothetical protein
VIHGRKDNEDNYTIIHDSADRSKKGKGVLRRQEEGFIAS